jgi:hypothetical protein
MMKVKGKGMGKWRGKRRGRERVRVKGLRISAFYVPQNVPRNGS